MDLGIMGGFRNQCPADTEGQHAFWESQNSCVHLIFKRPGCGAPVHRSRVNCISF